MAAKKTITICSKHSDVFQYLKSLSGKYDIIVQDPSSGLRPAIVNETDFLITDHDLTSSILFEPSGRLKWIQGTWAGVDKLIQVHDLTQRKPDLQVARLSNPIFSQLMAEYCVGAVISLERNFKLMRENQDKKLWTKTGQGVSDYRSLADLTIGILGVGEIGTVCAKALKGFGSNIVGLVNRPRPGDPIVSKYFVMTEVTELLSSVDYIINILPSTPTTNNILCPSTLQHCKNAGFINIGRGNVCSNADLLHALDKGWISQAFLDVFPTEPLEETSTLWQHPRVTVTPHVAAMSRGREISQCFLANLDLVDAGQPPANLVDWDKLY